MIQEYYCTVCQDTCTDPEDPHGTADCRHCGGSFAWRQRAAWQEKQRRAWLEDGAKAGFLTRSQAKELERLRRKP